MNCLVNRVLAVQLRTALAFCLLASSVFAAPPKITRLSVRGLQAGGTTRLSIQGSDLLPEPRLLADLPITAQQVPGTPRANAVDIDVTLAKDAIPGVYNLRLATADGITSPEPITVDHLPQRTAPAANAAPAEKLPVAVHGLLTGSTVQEIPFAGVKGQAITIDVLARRLGSKLRPVVHVYDSNRKQLAWSLPLTNLGGDARMHVTLPAEGTYTVAIHDLAYAAAAPSYYRVAIGQFDYVDAVYPPVVSRSGTSTLAAIGRIGAQPALTLDGTTVAAGDWRPVAWPSGAHPLGLRPRVQLSDLAELVEDRTLDASRQLPKLPIAVSGCLTQPGEVDVYHLSVAEGDKLLVEVFADRLGSPIDASIELKNDKGARLLLVDDTTGPDPRGEYTVVKGVNRVTLAISDAIRRGGNDCIYRVLVSRVDQQAIVPDFRLKVQEDTYHLTTDGTRVVRVEAERTNFDGPIRVTVEGLPAGFTAPPVEIPPGAPGALVEIRRTATTKETSPAHVTIRGTSLGMKPELSRVASFAAYPLGDLQPWLRYDLAVAPTHAAQAFAIAWDEKKSPAPLYLGMDSKLVVQLKRGPGAIGPVRLTLLTSQPTPAPLANGQPNVNQTLRGTTAQVDIPIDANVKAAHDALRAAEKAKADADKIAAAQKKLTEAEAKLKSTAEYAITVPADLKTTEYDVSIRAELRNVENNATLVEAFTLPVRLRALAPVELLAATNAEPVQLDSKQGATIALKGELKRLNEFAGDVTLTLAGLPTGIAPPRVVLKAKETKYELSYKLPANFAAAEVDGVQIVATLVPDSRRANVMARVEQSTPKIRVEKK